MTSGLTPPDSAKAAPAPLVAADGLAGEADTLAKVAAPVAPTDTTRAKLPDVIVL